MLDSKSVIDSPAVLHVVDNDNEDVEASRSLDKFQCCLQLGYAINNVLFITIMGPNVTYFVGKTANYAKLNSSMCVCDLSLVSIQRNARI